MVSEKVKESITRDEVLHKYPRLVAHMICESLGYWTPLAAAGALHDYIMGRENWCEWYMSMVSKERLFLDVNRDTIARAIKYRHNHYGYMAHYPRAIALVRAEIDNKLNSVIMFSSWQ